jgi:hypothetical protein
MNARTRLLTGSCTLAVAAGSLVACTSSTHRATTPTGAPTGSTVASVRWWSNSQVQAGSTIDASKPDAAVAKLQPSRTDYCHMLTQTVASGKSPLAGVAATDPKLRSSMTAFIGELQKVAPAAVSSDWKVVGTAVLALVNAGGKAPKASAVDGAALQKASAAIAADASSSCGVDLAAQTP